MKPNDHSATCKIHKCNFYIDKTRATIYNLQCRTEANEKLQSSLIHISRYHGWSITNRHALLTLRLTQPHQQFQYYSKCGRANATDKKLNSSTPKIFQQTFHLLCLHTEVGERLEIAKQNMSLLGTNAHAGTNKSRTSNINNWPCTDVPRIWRTLKI